MESMQYLQLDTASAHNYPSSLSLLPSPTDFQLAGLPFKAVNYPVSYPSSFDAFSLGQDLSSAYSSDSASPASSFSELGSSPASSHLATPTGSPVQLHRPFSSEGYPAPPAASQKEQSALYEANETIPFIAYQQGLALDVVNDMAVAESPLSAQHTEQNSFPLFSMQQYPQYQSYSLPQTNNSGAQHPSNGAAHFISSQPSMYQGSQQASAPRQAYSQYEVAHLQSVYGTNTAPGVLSMSMPSSATVPAGAQIMAAPSFQTPHGVFYFVPSSSMAHGPTPPPLDMFASTMSQQEGSRGAKPSSVPSVGAVPASASGKKRRQKPKNQTKRFVCPHSDCGRAFARNFNMQSHYKSHLGIRDYNCPYCPKKFSRRHDRARHCSAVHDAQINEDEVQQPVKDEGDNEDDDV